MLLSKSFACHMLAILTVSHCLFSTVSLHLRSKSDISDETGSTNSITSASGSTMMGTERESQAGEGEPAAEEIGATRLLATVTPPKPMFLSKDNIELRFFSAVPTFGPEANYIALIHPYEDKLWKDLKNFTLFCSGPTRTHEVAMSLVGGDSGVGNLKVMVWRCEWPKEEANAGNYEIFIHEPDGRAVGHFDTSYNPALLPDVNIMACVRPMFFGSEESRDTYVGLHNQVRMLPQWLEYNLMHGVDHFLFYTLDSTPKEVMEIYQPFVDAGVATRVHLVIPEHIQWIRKKVGGHKTIETGEPIEVDVHNIGWSGNDCLYRTKNHASWVLAIDVDEFVRLNLTGVQDQSPFNWKTLTQNLTQVNKEVHSIQFARYRYLEPQNTEQLLVSSPLREPALQKSMPKFVFNPSLVNAVFVHYPTSWVEGSVSIAVPHELAVANHYKLPVSKWQPAELANFSDPALCAESGQLQAALERRFKTRWETLSKRLELPTNNTARLSEVQPNEHQDVSLDQGLSASSSAWIDNFNRLHEVQVISLPSVIDGQVLE